MIKKLLFTFLILALSQTACAETTITDTDLTDVDVASNPMVTAEGTKFYKDGEPFYFVGVNCFQLLMYWLRDQADGTTIVEDYFDEWETDGVRVVRVILYVLDDALLIDPASTPTAVASVGGTLTDGKTYVYRYTGGNRSKTAFAYEWAETLVSPIVSVAITAPNQTVTLTMPSVDNAYRYKIYRRESTDAADSEKYIATVDVVEGLNGTYVDDGSDTPTTTGIPASNDTQNNPRTTWPSSTGTYPTDGAMPFITGIENYNEAKFVAMDNILELAREHNVMIMPCFADWHANNTGGAPDWSAFAGNISKQQFWGSCIIEDWFKDWLTTFIDRTNTVNNRLYKNDPAIFAYDLMNEPFGTYSGGSMRSWIRKMVTHIKTIDSNHMISISDDGSIYWGGSAYTINATNVGLSHDFLGTNVVEGLDFCHHHVYPESAGFVFDSLGLDNAPPVSGPLTITEFKAEMQKRADLNFIRKPIVFGELGLADWEDADDWIPEVQQAILDIKSTQRLGDNLLLNPSFQDGLSDWTFHASCSIDTETTFEQRQTLYITGIGSWSEIISQIITVQPNTDYWTSMIFSRPNLTGKTRFRIDGRVDPGDAWMAILSKETNRNTSYWQNFDYVEKGFYKLTSSSYTQFRIRVTTEADNIGDTWIARVECRPVEGISGNTAFGGIQWWNWGSDDFDKDNATVRQQLRDASAMY